MEWNWRMAANGFATCAHCAYYLLTVRKILHMTFSLSFCPPRSQLPLINSHQKTEQKRNVGRGVHSRHASSYSHRSRLAATSQHASRGTSGSTAQDRGERGRRLRAHRLRRGRHVLHTLLPYPHNNRVCDAFCCRSHQLGRVLDGMHRARIDVEPPSC